MTEVNDVKSRLAAGNHCDKNAFHANDYTEDESVDADTDEGNAGFDALPAFFDSLCRREADVINTQDVKPNELNAVTEIKEMTDKIGIENDDDILMTKLAYGKLTVEQNDENNGNDDSTVVTDVLYAEKAEILAEENDNAARHKNQELESLVVVSKSVGEITTDVIITQNECEYFDKVDGNWISRERPDYDVLDTSELNGADLKEDKSLCDKIKYSFGILKASLIPVASLAVFAYDIGGDVQLALKFRLQDELTYFWITVACLVVPALLMSVVDICWIVMGKCDKKSRFRWHDICRILIGGLSLGRLVRTCTCAVHTIQGIRNPEEKTHNLKADEKRRDEALLNFISAFTQDIVMLSVQLFIYFTGPNGLANPAHSLAGSTIGIAWTYSCLYRDSRKARQKSANLRIFGFLVFFIAALAALVAREISIVFFVIFMEIWQSAIVFSAHFIIMYILLWRQHQYEGGAKTSACAKRLYLTFFAFVSIFNFINVKEGSAAKRMIVFYVILYIESFIMAGIVLSTILKNESISRSMSYYLICLPVGFIVHVIFTSIYYLFLHPRHHACCKCDIEL